MGSARFFHDLGDDRVAEQSPMGLSRYLPALWAIGQDFSTMSILYRKNKPY
jgi:hypothetical protein